MWRVVLAWIPMLWIVAVTNGQTVDVVAYEGPPPPGFGEDVRFETFLQAESSRDDVIGFRGLLSGPGIDGDNYDVIWSTEVGLALLLQSGDNAPGTDVPFAGFFDLSVGAQSTMAVDAILDDARDGLWKRTAGPFELVAIEGELAPGFAIPSPYAKFDKPFIVDDGAMYVRANVLFGGGQTRRAIFTDRSGAMELLHAQFDEAGDDGPLTYLEIGDVNNDGDMIIRGDVAQASGVWLGSSGRITDVLKEGDPAPGWDGATIDAVYGAFINDADEIVVAAVTASPTLYTGLFANRQGDLQPIFVKGDPAPMTEPETMFIQVTGDPNINDEGDIVFVTTLYGPNIPDEATGAVWLDDEDGIRMLYRRGAQLTDAPFGTRLGVNSARWLNNAGQLVLRTFLFGDAVDGTNDKALVALSIDDPVPFTLLREGDQIQVGLEDVRTLFDFDVQGPLTPSGQILVLAEFTDETEALLRVQLGAETCLADFNQDGVLNVLDFVAFQTAFVAQDLRADCDANGQFQILDFVCFQVAFFQGCD